MSNLENDDANDDALDCERPTTPCPTNEGEHTALLDELDRALAIAKRSMNRIRIDDG